MKLDPFWQEVRRPGPHGPLGLHPHRRPGRAAASPTSTATRKPSWPPAMTTRPPRSAIVDGGKHARVVLEVEVDMCQHQPRCADALAPDHGTARVVASHDEQGWSLLCNGVVLFDDGGELLPDGRAIAPPPRASMDDKRAA